MTRDRHIRKVSIRLMPIQIMPLFGIQQNFKFTQLLLANVDAAFPISTCEKRDDIHNLLVEGCIGGWKGVREKIRSSARWREGIGKSRKARSDV